MNFFPSRPTKSRAGFAARTVTALTSLAVVGTLAVATAGPAAAANPVAPKKAPATIEVANPYVPQNSCDPTAKPGVSAFYGQVMTSYKTGRSLGIVQSCSVRTTPGGVSEHKEGRALDWGLRVSAPSEKRVADQFLAWATAKGPDGKAAYNARRMGIMYMIFNKRIYGVYNTAAGWRPYNGVSPHTDHIHLSFGWNGAMKRTSWWTGKAAPVDYGPCKPKGATWAPRYVRANPRPCVVASAPRPAPKPAPKPAPTVRAASSFTMTAAGTSPVVLTGSLFNKNTGKPLSSVPVTLRVRWLSAPGTWVNVASLRTSTTGTVSYKVIPTRAGYYEFVYTGSSSVFASATTDRLVKPAVAAPVPPTPPTPAPPAPPTAPPTSPTKPTTPPPAAAPAGTFWYTVAPGDTLRSIADEFDQHRSELRYLNRIERGTEVKAGQRILVLTEEAHERWHEWSDRH